MTETPKTLAKNRPPLSNSDLLAEIARLFPPKDEAIQAIYFIEKCALELSMDAQIALTVAKNWFLNRQLPQDQTICSLLRASLEMAISKKTLTAFRRKLLFEGELGRILKEIEAETRSAAKDVSNEEAWRIFEEEVLRQPPEDARANFQKAIKILTGRDVTKWDTESSLTFPKAGAMPDDAKEIDGIDELIKVLNSKSTKKLPSKIKAGIFGYETLFLEYGFGRTILRPDTFDIQHPIFLNIYVVGIKRLIGGKEEFGRDPEKIIQIPIPINIISFDSDSDDTPQFVIDLFEGNRETIIAECKSFI